MDIFNLLVKTCAPRPSSLFGSVIVDLDENIILNSLECKEITAAWIMLTDRRFSSLCFDKSVSRPYIQYSYI